MTHFIAPHAGTPLRPLMRFTAALALLASAGAAQALDYSGNFRGGPGLTSKNTARACYLLE